VLDPIKRVLSGPRPRLEAFLFVVLATSAAHVLYSHLGFSPTDEGYMLAGSRRLLDGQVPHRDYVSLRPVGTHLLHMHVLLWAGDSLILWSRCLGWLVVALTAWIWVRLVQDAYGSLDSTWMRMAIGAMGFTASAHSFPIMPWNTYDGLLVTSLGLLLALRPGPGRRPAGLMLLGCSALFRQSFALVLPLHLAVLGEAFRWRSWAAIAAPGVLYNIACVVLGAWPDAVDQMMARAGAITSVWEVLWNLPPVSLGIAASAVHELLARRVPPAGRRWALTALLAASGVVALHAAGLDPLRPPVLGGWLFLGLAAGAALAAAAAGPGERSRLTCCLAALVAAWGVALSEGSPKPTIAASALLAPFLAAALDRERRADPRSFRVVASVGIAVLLVASLVVFHRKRTLEIYRDLPAHQLTRDLTGVLRGARGIRTSPAIHDYLADVAFAREWIERRGKLYGLVPECAQFWVASRQPNPLPADWPIDAEISGPRTRRRVLEEIDRLRGRVCFIVNRYEVGNLTVRRVPWQAVVIDRIRDRYRKVLDLPTCEVYE
jgi:hypothetical protein